MNARMMSRAAMLLAVLGTITFSLQQSRAVDPPPPNAQAIAGAEQSAPAKPLPQTVTQGLAYLVAQQNADGGWGQGGGWRRNVQGSGRVDGENVSDPTDLGSTCIATLALIRAGNTPQQGPHAERVARAAALICDYVERSDEDSLYATDVRDTQLQSKIGRYVDTFLAGLVLSELKGAMPADGSDQRVLAALDKTVRKIEKHQGEDGNFAGNTGWASVLSQAVCSKFINRAAQADVAVKSGVLGRDFSGSVASLDLKTGDFAASTPAATGSALAARPAAAIRLDATRIGGKAATAPGETTTPSDAGVRLYYVAGNASRISDLANTTVVLEKRARKVLENELATRDEKEQAQSELDQIADVRTAQKAAFRGVTRQLANKSFVAGFGNNGGEEFLSYMNIAEMLVVEGGPEWEKWDKSMSANLGRVQNQDGSWSGQHCITGRTFCTAAALLTLMADRAPVPLAANNADSEVR